MRSFLRYDTGFRLAESRFSGKIVALLAADMLLGDERKWHGLTLNGTKFFFESECPRMLVLSRLELDDSIGPCCSMDTLASCHDAFVFRSPLHSDVRLDLFNFQQNVWQAENYAVGLLRHGNYELYNPCFDLPLFHNHVSDQRPNQNENRHVVYPHLNHCIQHYHDTSFTLPPTPPCSLHCSIFDVRRNDPYFCSCCLPQLNLTAQCEHARYQKWSPCRSSK
jgi:hypothetical protein